MRAYALGGLAFLAVASLAIGAAAQDRKAASASRVSLPNGLTVLLFEDHKAPVVGMELRYLAGSRDDPPGRPGLAALTARLMAEATKHVRPGEYDRLLDEAGAWDRSLRYQLDRTVGRLTVPAEQLALPLWLWSDQMGFFVERLDDKLIAEQVTVVLNERAQRENAPAGNLRDFADAAMYPPGHPYHGGELRGSEALRGVTVKEVRAFAEAHYRPDQAILSLAGDFDSFRALPLVHKYFAPIGVAGVAQHVGGTRPQLVHETRLHVAAHVGLPIVLIAWPTPAFGAPGDAELDIVAQLLAGSRIGWLRWSLVDRLKIASRVSAMQMSRNLGSAFYVEATAAPGHSPQEMLTAIDEVLAKLQTAEPDEHSLQSALAGHLFGPSFALEQAASKTGRFAECEELRLPGSCVDTWVERHTVDAKTLSIVAARELPLDRRIVAEVLPANDAPVAGELRETVVR